MQVCTSDDTCRMAKVSELFVYENFSRVPVETVEAGDICAVCGISDIMVSPLQFYFENVTIAGGLWIGQRVYNHNVYLFVSKTFMHSFHNIIDSQR